MVFQGTNDCRGLPGDNVSHPSRENTPVGADLGLLRFPLFGGARAMKYVGVGIFTSSPTRLTPCVGLSSSGSSISVATVGWGVE